MSRSWDIQSLHNFYVEEHYSETFQFVDAGFFFVFPHTSETRANFIYTLFIPNHVADL